MSKGAGVGFCWLVPKSAEWNVNPTVSVGIDARAGRAHIEPEVRYSYWNAGKLGMVRKNQANFLVGLQF